MRGSPPRRQPAPGGSDLRRVPAREEEAFGETAQMRLAVRSRVPALLAALEESRIPYEVEGGPPKDED